MTDILPPNSRDSEYGLLGTLFIDPSILPDIRSLIKPESFFSEDCREVFRSICAISDAGRSPIISAVHEHLLGRGMLEQIGGKETLLAIATAEFTALTASAHSRIVSEKSKLREIIKIGTDAVSRCHAPTSVVEPAESIAAILEAAAARVREVGWSDSIQSIGTILDRVISSKDEKAASQRLPTGLSSLDRLCGGVPIRGMTLIAGKAGMGKSQLCKQIALNNAMLGNPVGVISIEEDWQKIGENLLSNASGIESSKIVYNRLQKEDWDQIFASVPGIRNLPIYVDDAQQKLSDIDRTARRMVRKFGCKMIIIDHLHLIDAEAGLNRVQEITIISGGLKRMIKSLGVAGVVAAQMNRGGIEQDAPPELWNLRDSGSLEQDGDLIFQLHRQDYYEWKKQGSGFVPDHRLRIFVNKNKAGSVGYRDAYFDGNTQSVRDWTSEDQLIADRRAKDSQEAGPSDKVPSFEQARKMASRLASKFTLSDKQMNESARALTSIMRRRGDQIVTTFIEQGGQFDVSQFMSACK